MMHMRSGAPAKGTKLPNIVLAELARLPHAGTTDVQALRNTGSAIFDTIGSNGRVVMFGCFSSVFFLDHLPIVRRYLIGIHHTGQQTIRSCSRPLRLVS